jgi:hypothetical protein
MVGLWWLEVRMTRLVRKKQDTKMKTARLLKRILLIVSSTDDDLVGILPGSGNVDRHGTPALHGRLRSKVASAGSCLSKCDCRPFFTSSLSERFSVDKKAGKVDGCMLLPATAAAF